MAWISLSERPSDKLAETIIKIPDMPRMISPTKTSQIEARNWGANEMKVLTIETIEKLKMRSPTPKTIADIDSKILSTCNPFPPLRLGNA